MDGSQGRQPSSEDNTFSRLVVNLPGYKNGLFWSGMGRRLCLCRGICKLRSIVVHAVLLLISVTAQVFPPAVAAIGPSTTITALVDYSKEPFVLRARFNRDLIS